MPGVAAVLGAVEGAAPCVSEGVVLGVVEGAALGVAEGAVLGVVEGAVLGVSEGAAPGVLVDCASAPPVIAKTAIRLRSLKVMRFS